MSGTLARCVALTLAIFLAGAAAAQQAQPIEWTTIRADEVAKINSGLRPGVPTADIVIYYPSNLDAEFVAFLPLDQVIAQFVAAKPIFLAAGVQLRLKWIRSGAIDPAHFEIQANDISQDTPASRFVNMYEDSFRQGTNLSAEASTAFESIIERDADNHRTVYVVVLQNVFMTFFEPLDERTWEVRTLSTGGLSFPGYSYTSMDPRLRGVITLDKHSPVRSILAHELGHKLLNVSHEYREVDPQHEVRAEGGLMLYGSGTDIPSGAEGRWHRERLQMSPFLYREDRGGRKQWNAGYREGGHYYDPLYGDKVIRFRPAPPRPPTPPGQGATSSR